MTPAQPQEYRRTLIVVRYVLPSVLVVAGLAAFLFAFLAKVSMTGDTQQRKDEEARAYFDEHGRWPDDD